MKKRKPKKHAPSFFIALLLFSTLVLVAKNPDALPGPMDLRCNGQKNPLGMDANPALSWKLGDVRRGAAQTAYQVLASSKPALIEEGKGDVWDSGRIASAQSHLVPFGKPLRSGQRVHWKVRYWDQAGEPSPWSAPAWFETALLKAEDWQANWIDSAFAAVNNASTEQWADHRQYQISSDDELKDKTRFPAGMNSNEQNDTIVFIGQDRAKTIIKLKDNSPGFEDGKSKPLIRFYWLNCGSNVNQDNVIEGMTLDTGRGNPGAVAVLWNSSNFGAIRNLTVRSSDGLGVAGIRSDARNAQGLFENITVDGFQKGISIVSSSATLVAMDHLTFRNQTRCAIHVGNGSRIALRKGRTEGAPVAIHVEDGSQATIIDSEFKATEKTGTAVILKDSHLFARNILISGYGASIEKNGEAVVPSGNLQEYVSSTPLNPNGSGSPTASVPFPWVDEPYIPHETDSRNWAVVDDYGALGDAKTDDTAAIQAAMKSGKPAILFPKICYVVNGTVDIPATVRQISFLYGHTIRSERSDAAMFNIAEASAAPLLIQQNINLGGLFLDHTAVRPLVLRDSHTHFWFHFGGKQPHKEMFPWKLAMPSLETNHWRMYRNATPDKRKTVFVSNVHGFASGGPKLAGAVDNVLAYCRWVNTEHEVVNFSFRRSDVGILGCKLEMDGTHFHVSDGTKLEVLGGIYYQGGPNRTPVIIAKDSTISMSFSAFGGHNPADVILENWTGDVKQTIQRTDCPLLNPRNKNMPAIPLMVNTKADK